MEPGSLDMIRLGIYIAAVAIAGTASGGRLRDPWTSAKTLVTSTVEWFGELGFFCGRLIRAAIVPPYEFRELIRQCDEIGSKSLPLVALAGAATGVVLSL